MSKCFFCSATLQHGSGRMYVQNDGKILYFCKSKCWKNWNMGRDRKKLKWARAQEKPKAAAAAGGKK